MKRLLIGLLALVTVAAPAHASERKILVWDESLERFLDAPAINEPPENTYQPLRQIAFTSGVHVSQVPVMLFGVDYRHEITPVALFNGSIEAGQSNLPAISEAGASSAVLVNRFHAAVLTKSLQYVGAGVTYLQGTAVTQGAAASLGNVAVEAIVGAHLPFESFPMNIEYRFGVIGPSALAITGGVSF